MLSTSETIKDLEIIEGRRILHDFYHDRRVKNSLELTTLLECWRLCRKGTDLQYGDGRRVRFETSLGMKLGTRVFLEEILSNYYFNYIQGLVYAGAMILLVTVALYLGGSSIWFAYGGFFIEAAFLLLLSLVTAYSSNQMPYAAQSSAAAPDVLLKAINASISEMTTASTDLFRFLSQTDIRQDVLLSRLTDNIAKITAENTLEFANRLDRTNTLLNELHATSRDQLESLLQQQQSQAEQTSRLLAALESKAGGGSS